MDSQILWFLLEFKKGEKMINVYRFLMIFNSTFFFIREMLEGFEKDNRENGIFFLFSFWNKNGCGFFSEKM